MGCHDWTELDGFRQESRLNLDLHQISAATMHMHMHHVHVAMSVLHYPLVSLMLRAHSAAAAFNKWEWESSHQAPKASALTSRYPTQPTASASSAPARETAIQAPGSPHNARDRSDVERAFSAAAACNQREWESSLAAAP